MKFKNTFQVFNEKVRTLDSPVHLKEFQERGKAHISIDQKLLVRDAYLTLHPGVQVSLACDTCVLWYMNSLLSYYEREHPKYLATLAPPEPPAPTTTPTNKTNRRKKKS